MVSTRFGVGTFGRPTAFQATAFTGTQSLNAFNTLASSRSLLNSVNRSRVGTVTPNDALFGVLALMNQLLVQLTALIGGGTNTGANLNPRFVDGSTGPFDGTVAGDFGRNAFANRQALIDSGRFDPNVTTVRYTQEGQPRYSDLFAYSEEAIALRDANGDGTLSLREYAARFDSTRDAARTFRVLDQNGDNQLDASEIAALGLLTDANGDGQITPEERLQAERLLRQNPDFAATVVDELFETLDLRRRYITYLDSLDVIVDDSIDTDPFNVL